MSTSAVSTPSLYQDLQTYYSTRRTDLEQLGQDLQSGNLTAAQQDYTTIQNLGEQGPFKNGDAFGRWDRQSDFNAVGSALQSGNLSGADQAFEQLAGTFQPTATPIDPTSTTNPAASTTTTPSTAASATGPEIVLNLGNVPSGDQITIGVNSGASGGEQLTVSTANAQGQNTGEITLNLAQNSNEQIVLNLLDGTATSTTPSSGVSVTA